MFKIGEFSKLSRISIRMLRHYDEIGLLVPEETDPWTGYRRYAAAQLMTANRITALRGLGFSLAETAALLACWEDRTAMETRLLERQVASVRQILPCYDREGDLWHIFVRETALLHIQDGDPALCISVYHDGEYKEADVDVEIQKTVKGTYPDTEHVKFKTIPPVTVASATFQGPYRQIGEVNQAVASWVEDNGYAFDGLFFNIYHVSPHETRNPEEFVTEVCYPVRKR